MANELIGHPSASTPTLKGLVHLGTQVYDRVSADWKNFHGPDWARYTIDMTPDAGTGYHRGDLPAAAALAEYVTYYEGTTLGLVRAWQILRLGGPFCPLGTTGLTIRGVFRNGSLAWDRDAAAWVAFLEADWAKYLIVINELPGTGVYVAALPAGAEAWTHIGFHEGTSFGEAVHVQFRNTAAAAPLDGLTPPTVTIDPTASPGPAAIEPLKIRRGSGSPIVRFAPATPGATSASNWSARIVTRTSTLLTLTNGSGLHVDEAAGPITVNPTAAQTNTLPLDRAVFIELWRTGSGDDLTAPVARVRLLVSGILP